MRRREVFVRKHMAALRRQQSEFVLEVVKEELAAEERRLLRVQTTKASDERRALDRKYHRFRRIGQRRIERIREENAIILVQREKELRRACGLKQRETNLG